MNVVWEVVEEERRNGEERREKRLSIGLQISKKIVQSWKNCKVGRLEMSRKRSRILSSDIRTLIGAIEVIGLEHGDREVYRQRS